MPSPEFTLLLPCLDEAETLADCVAAARRGIADAGIEAEIVVADNGSTDGSPALAAALGARVVPVAGRGYGAALRGGLKAAEGRWVIMGDADGSYDFSVLRPFVERLRAGADLVMGCRLPAGGGTIERGAMPWKHRWLGNPALTFVGRLFFKSPVHDFHCGLRGFSRAAIETLDLRTTGMEFASEMVIKAGLAGLRIEEVPVTLRPDGRSRAPHLRSWRDGWRHLRFMLLYSPRWLFLYPGVALVVLGLAAGAWLLPGPRRVGPIELDVHTLAYAGLAVLLGFQFVGFAVFTRVFATTEGLLPRDPRLERAARWVSLERGLAIGALFVLAGLAGSLGAVGAWGGREFGHLEPARMLRVVIPSIVALAVGAQLVLSSFFLSVLALRRR